VAEPPSPNRRILLGVAAAACALVLVTVARGPVALLAAATLALLVGAVLGLPPLLRHDGIDWTWRSGRTDDVPPEPGIATLRRLLGPAANDATAAVELHQLVRAIADDRTRGRPLTGGRLAAYLSGPPRSLDLDEVDRLITELEALKPKETS
jgi:hypothetical protein